MTWKDAGGGSIGLAVVLQTATRPPWVLACSRMCAWWVIWLSALLEVLGLVCIAVQLTRVQLRERGLPRWFGRIRGFVLRGRSARVYTDAATGTLTGGRGLG
jgi:hypothetical protein